jgi:excisionase family DNA binding protein
MAAVPTPEVSAAPELLTVHEVAEAARVSPATVRRAISDGDLHTLRFRGAVRIERRELARYLGAEAR